MSDAGSSAATRRLDCIVIGGGHNGLVCATYLARAGRSVLVLEAAGRVGGAAVTREFAPGYRVSAGAHLLHLMPRALMDELGLAGQGFTYAGRDLPTTAIAAGLAPLPIGAPGQAALQAVSPRDAAAYPAFSARLRRFAVALYPLLDSIPPRLGSDAWTDRIALLKLGWRIRTLGRREMRELLRIIGMNAYDLIADELETPRLQGALGFDAVLGTNFGPRAPGTVLTLLTRLAAESAAGSSPLAQPRGGLGALSEALAKAAVAAGATVRTGTRVARIRVQADRAVGVVLDSGESIDAGTVISNADAKSTFFKLLGTRHLDTGFVRKVDHLRSRGLAAKLHLALDRLPSFPGLPIAALGGRLLIAPSLDYIERAWDHSKYGECSSAPTLEITLPTVNDPSLAPAGRHVLSAIVQYVPYQPAAGWAAERARYTDVVLATLEAHAPGLRSTVTATEFLTPADLEREFGMSGGHWHHGDLAFDQFYMVRPVPGAAQYRTPVTGLYLCGASCHPGGGVMGLAGRNAARAVLRKAA
ncbi:MAG TPA: NAD(P)/FAD-dependent oxidoreductase [Steroidobacteraceae bacterium]|nr:NAD(P)/FAD-dependent oxidoreductase [Steroidobacteraceae bacterium]